jgi:hydroxylaminobenzene mutase
MLAQLSTQDARRRLIWHGIFLFFLGLLTGFLVNRAFTNPRMGLSAHLEGVMNGTFLAVLGAVWGELRLPARATTATFWLALYVGRLH